MVNSHLLYRLSYRGMVNLLRQTALPANSFIQPLSTFARLEEMLSLTGCCRILKLFYMKQYERPVLPGPSSSTAIVFGEFLRRWFSCETDIALVVFETS